MSDHPRFNKERTYVGAGWQHILDSAAKSLDKLAPNWDAVQIKEKFGTLRLYVMTGDGFDTAKTGAFWAAVRAAETRSEYTCEDCGSTDSTVKNETLGAKNGWWRTLCGHCRRTAYEKWLEHQKTPELS